MYAQLLSGILRLLSPNLNQSPDNPLQFDRLPDHRAVELDYPV